MGDHTKTRVRRSVRLALLLALTAAAAACGNGPDQASGEKACETTTPEMAVFLEPGISEERVAELEEELRSEPFVESISFVDQDEAYEEFKDMYADNPDMVASVDPGDLPPSFRVLLADWDAEASLRRYLDAPGVRDVVAPARTVPDRARDCSEG